MSKVTLSPYTRLRSSGVVWNPWSVSIDERPIALNEVADQADAHSALTFAVEVTVPVVELEKLGLQSNNLELVVSVSCSATAFSKSGTVRLTTVESSYNAAATVTISGDAVAESLSLRAHIISRSEKSHWLARRILATAPVERVPLDSEQIGFPTVSFSFGSAGLPDAPWRLIVDADEPEASFMHSVRLELNEDFPLVCDYLDGKNVPLISSQITALIVRVLVGTIARLVADDYAGRSPDEIALDEPDSIAASAARAAKNYLNSTLGRAVSEYQAHPEVFEMKLATGTNISRAR